MQNQSIIGAEFLKELEAEVTATGKCLEKIPGNLFDWKPHEKSLPLGYLSLIVAEIPKWIQIMIEESEIDFATFEHFEPKDSADLMAYFEKNLELARHALQNITDEVLAETFYLKNQGKVLFS